MKYDYFVSGKWRNRDNVRSLAEKIRNSGKTAYCFFDAKHNQDRLEEDPHESMQKFEATPNWRNNSYVKHVYESDMNGLRESEVFIMLLPAGRSCHIEAGTAFGMGKKCILIGEQKEAESLYLIFDTVFPTIDDFISIL